MQIFTVKWFALTTALFVSCSGPHGAAPPQSRLDFSLKNSSSEIVTVLLADESSVLVIQGFCRKLSTKDFPLTAVFSGGSSITLNEPSHWRLEGPSRKEKSATPCKPPEDI